MVIKGVLGECLMKRYSYP
uniref:Uncharacterized protein n=1 Tax=Arundo donax TaxID=35708 RepID=A0A0A9C6U8_ARUDO